MRIVYKRGLTFIGLLLVLCGVIGVAYLFYDKIISNDTIVMVDNELSINYLNGYKISTNGEFKFSISNNGNHDVYYNILINNMKDYDTNITYSLVSNDTNLSIQNQKLEDTDVLLNSALIKAGATENFTLTIKNNTSTTFEIKVKKVDDIEEYFYSTILKNNQVKKSSSTLIGTDIAKENEGLIEDVDDYGVTYYFRGNVPNNYVSFAGTTWRIIRINGDGTVKLILNTLAEDLTSYNSSSENYENYIETNIYKTLNTYYETNLKNYDEMISNAKFCHEIEKTEGTSENVYNAYTRTVTNKIPTFNCLGEQITSKIGLMSVDEIMYAGANLNDDNKEYYLHNESINNYWWSSSLAKSKNNDFYPFAVSNSGKISYGISGMLNRGLRPVININKKVTVTGDGTETNPYILNSD